MIHLVNMITKLSMKQQKKWDTGITVKTQLMLMKT